MGAGSPKLVSHCHLPFWGDYFGKGEALEWNKPFAAQCGLWGAMTTCFSPDSQEGHMPVLPWLLQPHSGPLFTLVSAKLLSCHSATATLSAARSLAELGTKGVRGGRSASLPQTPLALLERASCEHPTSTTHFLQWLPWSRGFPSLHHMLAEIARSGVPAGSPSPDANEPGQQMCPGPSSGADLVVLLC